MLTPQAADFRLVLRTLNDHGVDYIVIGGVCAVVRGAPVNTFDLDIVHSRESENLDRLVAALQELDAYYREQPERCLRPRKSFLEGMGHGLLMTRAGPLDVLGCVTGDRTYEDLLAHSSEVRLEDGLTVRALDLPMLITLKEEANRDKDRAVLPVLRQTLKEQQRQ